LFIYVILVHDVLKDQPMMTKFPLANFQKLSSSSRRDRVTQHETTTMPQKLPRYRLMISTACILSRFYTLRMLRICRF